MSHWKRSLLKCNSSFSFIFVQALSKHTMCIRVVTTSVQIENEFSLQYIKIVLCKITVAYFLQTSECMETMFESKNGTIIQQLFHCWWLNYSWIFLGVQLFLDIHGRTIIPGSGGKEAKRRKSSVFGRGLGLFLLL